MPYRAEDHDAENRTPGSAELVEEHLLAAVASPSTCSAIRVFTTLGHVYAAAPAALTPHGWDSLDGGAGGGKTLNNNRRSFARWRFRPRVRTSMGEPRSAIAAIGPQLLQPACGQRGA